MNHLLNLTTLHNRYFAMRHGQSLANVAGIIISHPQNGTHPNYALSELGRSQALASARASSLGSDTLIYSSDFSRAFETADIVREAVGAQEIHVARALRERNFGEYEKTDHTNYARVWEHDATDASHQRKGVESVDDVMDRATALILYLEEQYAGRTILLVSHGDTLQILQTAFQKASGTQHRSLRHLETAEIRELTLESREKRKTS